ncbi:MAG: YsnF/AvaK domain-containing protein [Psychrobacter sp.]|nr:YsnF/AvaK domain-containing protein [Psychrobacter sp.]
MNNDNNSNNLAENPALFPTAATSSVRDANESNDNMLAAVDSSVDKEVAAIRDGGGYLELLEERPVINKERVDTGRVTVTKHRRTKMIEVPVELVEEYITVQTEYYDAESRDLLSGNYDDKDILRHVEPSLDSKAVITINNKQVAIGDAPIEIVISRQVATITKQTYAIQEVAINKSVHTHVDNIEVELKHEELDVQEEGFLDHSNKPIVK